MLVTKFCINEKFYEEFLPSIQIFTRFIKEKWKIQVQSYFRGLQRDNRFHGEEIVWQISKLALQKNCKVLGVV